LGRLSSNSCTFSYRRVFFFPRYFRHHGFAVPIPANAGRGSLTYLRSVLGPCKMIPPKTLPQAVGDFFLVGILFRLYPTIFFLVFPFCRHCPFFMTTPRLVIRLVVDSLSRFHPWRLIALFLVGFRLSQVKCLLIFLCFCFSVVFFDAFPCASPSTVQLVAPYTWLF